MSKEQKEEEPGFNFEKSFLRLEDILEKLNSGTVSLDDAIKLYEEADKLIVGCHKRLTEAERKIEVLIKNRTGELATDDSQKPLSEEFTPPTPGNEG